MSEVTESARRDAKEAIALEGYRSRRLSEFDVREMLGFATPMQVHSFLKEHGVHLHYSMTDLEQDIRESDRLVATLRARRSSGNPIAG